MNITTYESRKLLKKVAKECPERPAVWQPPRSWTCVTKKILHHTVKLHFFVLFVVSEIPDRFPPYLVPTGGLLLAGYMTMNAPPAFQEMAAISQELEESRDRTDDGCRIHPLAGSHWVPFSWLHDHINACTMHKTSRGSTWLLWPDIMGCPRWGQTWCPHLVG